MRRTVLAICLGVFVWAGGCATPPPEPPTTLDEYRRMQGAPRQSYPQRTILLHNLQRVMNPDLTDPQRVDSLKLVMALDRTDPEVTSRLRELMQSPDTSHSFKQAAAPVLRSGGHRQLARHANVATPETTSTGVTRAPTNTRSPVRTESRPLQEIVRQWSQEPLNAPSEQRYRRAIEQATGRSWQHGLIEAINAQRQGFPRGRALEILAARLSDAELKRRIEAVTPRNESMAALHAFIDRFGYVPQTRSAFASVVSLNLSRREMMREAAQLQSSWRRLYGYRFNVRDFHLLSRLGRDPLRGTAARGELIRRLTQSLSSRQHVPYSSRSTNRAGIATDKFQRLKDSLSAADLWNLYLFDEMLKRPRMQRALRIIADRQQRQGGLVGGLVFYRHGQAEALLYPNIQTGGEDWASERMVQEGRDALGRFRAHFERDYNTQMVGPGAREIARAREENYYGLVLTSLNELAFAAHYYNPDGQVVSLGKYAFRQ